MVEKPSNGKEAWKLRASCGKAAIRGHYDGTLSILPLMPPMESERVDQAFVNRRVSGQENMVLDTDVPPIFEELVTQGGGRITLGNGRGLLLDLSVYQAGPRSFRGSAQIHFLSRTPQGRFTTFAFADIPDIDEARLLGRYGQIVASWLGLCKVGKSQFDDLCLQILDQATASKTTDTRFASVRKTR